MRPQPPRRDPPDERSAAPDAATAAVARASIRQIDCAEDGRHAAAPARARGGGLREPEARAHDRAR